MGTNSVRHVILVGLEVTDEALYARYRSSMSPILASYGGAFGYDLLVSKVLKSPTDQPINRVFTISFPDRETKTRFFADQAYLEVRAELFDPAVSSTTLMAEYDTPGP